MFYPQYHLAVKKYHLLPENIYNWDEKGFIIGQAPKTKRIMTLEAYKSGRIRQAIQDGNREFITLMAYISERRTVLQLALCVKQW